MDSTEAAAVSIATRDEADFGGFDVPVHTGLFDPDFDGLLGSELIAEAMPRCFADIGRGFDEMHVNLL